MAKTSYKNAAKGVGRLFGAQIMMLLSTIAIGVAGIIMQLNGGAEAFTAISVDNIPAWAGATMACGLAGLIIMLIALCVELSGLYRAGKDNGKFKTAFALTIFVFIAQIALSVLTNTWPDVFTERVKEIADAGISGVMLVIAYYTIMGGVELLEKRSEKKTAMLGRRVWAIYIVAILVMLAACLLLVVPNIPAEIGCALAVIAALAEVFGGICYLVFLGKAKNRLA